MALSTTRTLRALRLVNFQSLQMEGSRMIQPLFAAIETVSATASNLQLFGAGGFGFLIGWYVYYVNRWRKDDVQLSDLVTVIGAIGGAAILTLFEAKSDLFGAYGIGLFIGFFGYFITLIICVNRAEGFTSAWFLDGRAPAIDPTQTITPGRAMGERDTKES
jgi:hypothetical protein